MGFLYLDMSAIIRDRKMFFIFVCSFVLYVGESSIQVEEWGKKVKMQESLFGKSDRTEL